MNEWQFEVFFRDRLWAVCSRQELHALVPHFIFEVLRRKPGVSDDPVAYRTESGLLRAECSGPGSCLTRELLPTSVL